MTSLSCDSDDATKLVHNCKDGYTSIGDSKCAKIGPFVSGALTILGTDRVTFNSISSTNVKTIPATSILECIQEIVDNKNMSYYGIKLYPQKKEASFFVKNNKVGSSSSYPPYTPYPPPEDFGGEKVKNLKDLDTVKKHSGYYAFIIKQPDTKHKNINIINIQYESCSEGEIFIGSCKGSTTHKYSISDIYFEQSQIPLIQSNTQGVECRKELVYASSPWKSGSGTAPDLMFEWCNEHQDLNICKRYCDQYPIKCQVTPTKDLILLGTALILLIFIVVLIAKGVKIRASMPIIKKTPVKEVSTSSLGRDNNLKKLWKFDSSKPNNWWADKTKGDSSKPKEISDKPKEISDKPKEISGKPKEKFSFKKLLRWFSDKKLWFLWALIIIMIVAMIILLIISIKGLYSYFTKPIFDGSDSDYKQVSNMSKDRNFPINYDNLYSWQNMHNVSTNVKTRCEKGIPYYKPGDKNYNSDWKYGYNYPQQCIINYCTNSTGDGNVPDVNKAIREGTQNGNSCCYKTHKGCHAKDMENEPDTWIFSNGGCFQSAGISPTNMGNWDCCGVGCDADTCTCGATWYAHCHGNCAPFQVCHTNCCNYDTSKNHDIGYDGGTPYDGNSTLPYSAAAQNNTWKQFTNYASSTNPNSGNAFCFNSGEWSSMQNILFPGGKFKKTSSVDYSIQTCDNSKRGYCYPK